MFCKEKIYYLDENGTGKPFGQSFRFWVACCSNKANGFKRLINTCRKTFYKLANVFYKKMWESPNRFWSGQEIISSKVRPKYYSSLKLILNWKKVFDGPEVLYWSAQTVTQHYTNSVEVFLTTSRKVFFFRFQCPVFFLRLFWLSNFWSSHTKQLSRIHAWLRSASSAYN